MQPKALILHVTGSNRDHDAAMAFSEAGALPEIVHLNQLRRGDRLWQDYQILVIPGGFSYADALGAGKLLALDLITYFVEEVSHFVESGKPVIGICNGFQALVKAGILPEKQNPSAELGNRVATLTHNASGQFECRWVTLKPISQRCIWTRGLQNPIYCPVAHGEGNFYVTGPEAANRLFAADQVALIYAFEDGTAANGAYPYNPNGSIQDIAGVSNAQGNVLGLMPHPENHIHVYQHPRWTRNESNRSGLPLFENGVAYAKQM